MNLMDEWKAVFNGLNHYRDLDLRGGGIIIDGRMEAFALGERLNDETAVIHIEKANPHLPGRYTLVNQQFCEHCWAEIEYINREQDLGEPGLRKAQISYHPDHLEEKYTIRLRS